MTGAGFLAARKAVREADRDLRARCRSKQRSRPIRTGRFLTPGEAAAARERSGRTPPLLDAAFLVPNARRARFKAAARQEASRCAAAGAQMMLTGPWPVYNFTGDDGETT